MYGYPYLEAEGAFAPGADAASTTAQLAALAQSIPETLRQTIAHQLARLTPAEQRLLDVASVGGVAWSAATVAAGLEAPVVEVEAQCEALARRGIFLVRQAPVQWPDGTVATGYGFLHALYQQMEVERLPAAACQRLHQRLGARLEEAYGVQTGVVAVELAIVNAAT